MLRHNMPRLKTAISSPGKVLKEVMLPVTGMVSTVELESRLCNDAFDVPSAHQQAPTPLAIDSGQDLLAFEALCALNSSPGTP